MKQLHRSGCMNNNQFSLQNIFISSFFCILVGTILFINSQSILWSSASVTIFIAGIILMIIGLILKISITMDTKKIDNWVPDSNYLPDAGRAMYRIDTTLTSPTKTSILCGKCKHIEWVEGKKPTSYTCTNCGILLWENNEEE
mgnify:CR=1 FL=1